MINITSIPVLKIASLLLLFAFFSQSWAFAADTIYIVSSRNSSQFAETIEAFKSAVSKQKKKISFKTLHLPTDSSLLNEMALQSKDTRLIFTLGTRATRQVLSRSGTVPVISTFILSEEVILQSNQATGIVLRYPMSVQLNWLTKVLPDVKRVGILYSPNKNSGLIKEAKLQAKSKGLTIIDIAVDNPRNLPAALDEMYRRSDVLLAIPDREIYSGKTLKQIMLTSFRNRVPLIGLSRNWVEAGAIYAIESDYKSIGKQSGGLADSIINKRKMPDDKFYYPDNVNLIINEKTMRHMRREIDALILNSAVQVYR